MMFSAEDHEALEQQSFKNRITFHREELTAINKGEHCRTFFGQSYARQLQRNGVLTSRSGKDRTVRVTLTEKAKKLLEIS